MPLHGKIVVIKRSGGDGTEFPLTAACLFGRNTDCDIRIQLPQVSREHCRIDLNENKEVVLTNLSSANPTRVNGEALQQSERLKHGDVITIIDRSFRFEYPPAPTPKKRSSRGGKTETLKVLQDQQDGAIVGTGEKRISEISTDPHLKDAANHDNIQRSLEKTVEMESKEDDSLVQSNTASPFSDLYQMIKKSLDVKTPRKSSASLLQTPSSKFCSPKPGSVKKSDGKLVIFTEDTSTPKNVEAKVLNRTPESVKKQKKVVKPPSAETAGPTGEEAKHPTMSEATSPRRRSSATPQKFTLCEVIEQVTAQTSKSPVRRRSKEGTPAKAAVTKQQDKQAIASPKTKHSPKASPRGSEKAAEVKEVAKKRKSGELGTDLPAPKMKKKRVSFGGFLSPELFDKRLPPDSPLRKGATPRRSLSLVKPKESLLRRASVIGLLKEFDKDDLKKSPSDKSASPETPASAKKSPKSRSTSPKAASPGKNSPKSRSSSPKATSPAKKSPKSKSPSPKAASPAKNSPKSRSSSPKTATPVKKSPKSKSSSPKAASPGKKSPKSTSPKAASPTGKRKSSVGVSCPASQENAPSTGVTPVKTPVSSGVQTPSVQGRFSVSRISTPSPVVDVVADQMPSVTVTPKIPIRRKSMKSASRKTPSISKSAVKMMHRSGLSRVSMKVVNSWAHIVKFGETKAPIVAPPKKIIAKKTTKKAVPKSQTPARKLKDLMSTGHANSPATIVVGRAHKQKVVLPTGAAPRVVTNTALLKKNLKMDEDLTGISEMFKTPVNEKKRKSVINENSAVKTPAGGLGTSVIEPSVLNTPEEPDEMMVSPLSVASTVKGRQYNREAVQRLLNGDQESSFVGDIPALDTRSECSEEQHTDIKTTSVTTPKQKPELPESLTGVKRIMKTPRQKAEPVDDLRGKLLKTPKQKSEQKECLSGIKRIMKTPRQKAEPVEDLRGKILKTPKQKAEQQECLTGVKRVMKTPRQKAEPLEDIRGELLTTPKQKPAQQECLTGVKRIFETPKQQAEPIEDLRGKLLMTPEAPEAVDVSLGGVKEVLQTPANVQESKDLSEMTNAKTPDTKSSPVACLTGIKRIMKTPKQKNAPVEDMVGVKRLMRTPRRKGEPIEENFGIKRLMKSPRLRGIAPVEDFEGLQELMEEPLTDPTGQLETNEDEAQMPVDGGVDVTKEANADGVVSDHLEEPSVMETVSQAAADEHVTLEQPKVDTVDENVPEVESAAGKVTEMDTAVMDPGNDKKSARGRRAKTVESKPAQDKQEAPEPSEEPVVAAPVRGRRKKTEATAPPAVRQTRGRNAKATESRDVELTVEESAPQPSKVTPKPKRGRNAKKASDDQVEIIQEVVTEMEMAVEPESEPSPAVVDHKAIDSAAPLEKAVLKPRRGRKAKQPEQSVPEQQDEPCMQIEDVPQADMTKADANEACSDQMEVMPGGADNKSDAKKTILQAPETESLPDVETAEVNAGDVEKKSVRGRRAKVVESKEAEDKQEAAQDSEEPVVTAPVRGRRGRKVEVTAPPAVRQTKRGRNAKSQESSSDQPAVETRPMTEVSTEAVSAQTSLINANQGNDSAPPAEKAVVKPLRGRKTKQTPVEPAKPKPEQNEAVSGKQAQPQQPIPVTAAKPRRGRKTKLDTEEQHEAAEDSEVKVETTLQSEPPVRSKRGRNAKQEDKVDTDSKTAESQEPVQKGRRARKTEQDHVEPREVQTTEVVVPEKEEAPLAEPVTVSEPAPVATQPRRGGRKAKQDTESVTAVESTEVQEVPVVTSTNKHQRGRRGKQVSEEAAVTAKDPECDLEAEEKKKAERAAPVVKPSKSRGVKSSVKNEISQTVPAKRARRGAAPPEEASAESTESATTSVEPAKRGRRAAAKPTTDEATVISDQANPSKNVSKAVVEDTKTTKRSVKWKSDLEVIEIPKATPVKAVRGRKLKLGDHAENKNVSRDANKPEEEDLSDKVVEARPVKRARRGAAADKAEATSQVNLKETAEAETQPKTRRGRSTKK
ncbi:proliferation marker protein Ki-67 isoform X1 [Acanthochromis polyacanthus]|uniref:proliferation marker protein Ki-67 isoform X1 n=1 Tax=Acanthochromis polyacanthus TaxID=80966 RepID=UPI002234AB1A|nr:proliferation marker protein Ki-67 isoform X1 [Acanthochromis polyacanthus]